jgi:hypothetical protein
MVWFTLLNTDEATDTIGPHYLSHFHPMDHKLDHRGACAQSALEVSFHNAINASFR